MSARWVQGDPRMAQGFPVLTAQGVATFDMLALSSGTIVRAADQAWASAVSTPSVPTLANSAVAIGSPLTNALTGVKISYQFPWGEGTLSAPVTTTPTAAAAILVSGTPLVPPTPALWTNIYVESAAGSGTYLLHSRTLSGSSVLIESYGAGAIPYAGNPGGVAVSSGALQLTQYNFAQAFLGVSNQTKIANNAFIFGSSLDPNGNVLMMVIRGPSAIIEFDCAAATFNVGDYIAPAKDTGNALLNQKVVGLGSGNQLQLEKLAIGRVSTYYSANTTKVCVELLSRYITEQN